VAPYWSDSLPAEQPQSRGQKVADSIYPVMSLGGAIGFTVRYAILPTSSVRIRRGILKQGRYLIRSRSFCHYGSNFGDLQKFRFRAMDFENYARQQSCPADVIIMRYTIEFVVGFESRQKSSVLLPFEVVLIYTRILVGAKVVMSALSSWLFGSCRSYPARVLPFMGTMADLDVRYGRCPYRDKLFHDPNCA
jgi:hypothetical protein